jgi:hypothetical protein
MSHFGFWLTNVGCADLKLIARILYPASARRTPATPVSATIPFVCSE